MQDNPPPPGDNQAPREPDEQAQPNQQPPEEAREPENAASPSSKEPPQAPYDEADSNLNDLGLSDARSVFADGSGSNGVDGTPTPNTPYGQQLKWVKTLYQKSAVRERYTTNDHLKRYELAMDTLEVRLPNHHSSLADIMLLCNRLRENIKFCRDNGPSDNNTSERNNIVASLDGLSIKVIKVSFFVFLRVADNLDDEGDETSQVPPQTPREVAKWYWELNGFMRCYVIAACVLQGAPSHEVSRAAHELYTLIEQAHPQGSATPNDQRRESLMAKESASNSVDEILRCTHTKASKLDGDSAERIMWRDEAFDPLVREFLARQATIVGMRFADRNLLDILEEWVISGNEERSLRAGRVLAGLWWRQHRDKVLELADTWAHSADENTRLGGATLLYGAYAAEQAETPGMKATDSVVLRRLREWADWRDDAELAQGAAYSYGLIGREWPEVALDGLDHLLCLGASARLNNATPPLPVIFLAMLSYMEMAASGQVRPLLNRFASHATDDVQGTPQRRAVFEDENSHRARERRLGMLFFHVVFLMALSLDGVQRRKTHASYLVNVGLRQFPIVPSSRGQDVLLAGVLAEPEREWRANVQALFCAAIFSGRESFVFDVLESWIHIVTFEPHRDARDALLRFVVGMHAQLHAWDDVPQNEGRVKEGSHVLKERLSFWTKATHEHVLRPFAQSVLDALHK